MFAVLGLLAGMSLVMQRRTTELARQTEIANSLAALYRDADHWVHEASAPARPSRSLPERRPFGGPRHG